MTQREYFKDKAGNRLVLDHDGRLTGYDSKGEKLDMAGIKKLIKDSKLDITLHQTRGVESKYLARMAKEMLEK
jgi:hypothetical protein